jgi:hypothetical protein
MPINVDCFGLSPLHPNCPLVDSVCCSFHEGVWHFATIDGTMPATFDFSDCEVPEAGLVFLHEQHDAEVACGCYSPAFGTELLPGMHSTPVGMVPKPHTDKYRLINDLSTGPHAPNSWITHEDSKVCFNNLQDFSVILRNVHKEYKCAPAWLFNDNVSGAY